MQNLSVFLVPKIFPRFRIQKKKKKVFALNGLILTFSDSKPLRPQNKTIEVGASDCLRKKSQKLHATTVIPSTAVVAAAFRRERSDLNSQSSVPPFFHLELTRVMDEQPEPPYIVLLDQEGNVFYVSGL